MSSVKEIFDKINIWYDGVKLSEISALKDYGTFLCSVIDASEKHAGAIALHTGSEYYQAIAIALAALRCLFYHNTDISELIESLSAGDKLIMNGRRVVFIEIVDGSKLGMQDKKFFVVRFDEKSNGIKYFPLETLQNLNISLYKGEAKQLGGRGVKNTLMARKDFISYFSDKAGKGVLSTEIDHSVAIILDKSKAEDLYHKIYFTYENKKVYLHDLVTASYYSADESYQIGTNSTKEEPVLRFFSKVSSCRNAIMDDKQKKIIGCVVADENFWLSNSEIKDIVDRKSLKFSVMMGKTHYTHYSEWIKSGLYRISADVPETVKATDTCPIKKELLSFAQHKIFEYKVQYETGVKNIDEIKTRLLRINKECINGDEKENFLLECYFLMKLCRSAFFPLSYCDKAHDKNILGWTLSEKTASIKQYENGLIGQAKEDVRYVADGIEQMVLSLYDFNPKGELIKSRLMANKEIYVVAAKPYYENLFLLWLADCKINVSPKIINMSALTRNKCIYDEMIFPTGYNDFFNPYASFGFTTAEIVLYEYEQSQNIRLKNVAEVGRKLLHDKNSKTYDISTVSELTETDNFKNETFEEEMYKMAQDLQLKKAYRYISSAGVNRENTAKAEKIFTFASGSVGYFTKYYKGYAIRGENIFEADLDDFDVGDSMVFTKQNENKDIVDMLLSELLNGELKNTPFPECYRLSICWKQALREYMDLYDLSYQQLADKLKRLGCSKNQVTIRAWLIEEFHIVGPRDVGDYEAIVALTKLAKSADEIKTACEKIRKLRTGILVRLGKAILHDVFAADDPVSNICQKNSNLIQLEQITNITNPDIELRVPINIINKPFNV